ncbi:uncharacterized protein LOC122367299 [Amphibalanus amphitrite]|uniref:uncharacterized protein LOC122367299 n=1 Tax=Amphibalanus amphitrite TaxID=1232801 RepID=UPI001C8FF1B2|nr:uncharacterized protein LOC122367299 [Amphibalanus amphitrite]
METYVPRRAVQARAVKVVDAWFDVVNSRSPYDQKKERCGYGITAEIKARQDQALAAMDELVRGARKATSKQPLGRATLLPFQHGVLRTNASLRGLYLDAQTACPGLGYIMTSHVNQDCVENAFSQLRGMCGRNTTPDAVEARIRLRIMLMAPSPLAAVQSRSLPVQVEGDTDFLSTCAQPLTPNNVTNAAYEGLDVEDEYKSCVILIQASRMQIQDSIGNRGSSLTQRTPRPPSSERTGRLPYQSAMDQPPLPPATGDDDDPLPAAEGAAAAAPVTDELGVDREALAFVAGYVASKRRHLCSGLGQPSSCSPASAFVPSRWLQTISRGNLYVLSEW